MHLNRYLLRNQLHRKPSRSVICPGVRKRTGGVIARLIPFMLFQLTGRIASVAGAIEIGLFEIGMVECYVSAAYKLQGKIK